jgi:2,3-diketo-5-methylthio-1-phosphopentane phosphatase
MHLNIFCDFDGTITRSDATDLLLEAFADPAWEEIEAEWKAGRIGSALCMERQVALMRADHAALDALIDRIPVDPDFARFARWCRAERIALTVVSDGLDYVIRRVLRRIGAEHLPIVANHLAFVPGGTFAMTSPHQAPGCEAGTCKCRVIERGPDPALNVLIGDGRSDFCGAEAAHVVIAKDSLLKHCRTKGLRHHSFADFGDVLRIVAALNGRMAVMDLVPELPASRSSEVAPVLLPHGWPRS